MKKNKMMRLASCLLVAVMLTTSVISGTFAKYVTSDSATDTARVAKWGVTVTTEGETTFADSYDGTVVTSVTEQNVVAPGTKNDTGVTFTITGKPEVKVKVDIDLKVKDEVFLKAGTYPDTTKTDAPDFTFAEDYYPVVFKLTKDGVDVASGKLADIATALNDTYLYDANSDTLAGVYKLTWEWAFPTTDNVETDQKDTLLGNLAAGLSGLTVDSDKYSTVVDFNIAVTVTQID